MNKSKAPNSKETEKKRGSLIIVGTGFQAVRHFTFESKRMVELADKVLYLVTDPVSELYIKKLNPNSESLISFYAGGKFRPDTYKEMVELTLKYVREGLNLCVVYYGHPGVFVNPSHESIRRARAEGFHAQMLPAISAEDCLFADIGIDPGTIGCQSFETTDFLLNRRIFDTSSHLILWQIGIIGDFTYNPDRDSKHSITILVHFLKKYYGDSHEVYVYQAPEYVICKPIIQRLSLSKLPTEAQINYASTLYVPPKTHHTAIRDYKMAHKLGVYDQLKPTEIHFSLKGLLRLK